MKKILYFLDFPTGFGGAANTIIKQAEIMKQHGYCVRIVIPLDRSGNVVEEFQNRCQQLDMEYCFLKYSVTAIPEDIDVVRLFEDYAALEEAVSSWMPHVVHSSQINLTVEMVCRKWNIPHIMNIYQIEDRFFKAEYPAVFPRYHICDSELYRREWEKHIHCDSIYIRNVCKRLEHEKSTHSIPFFICVGTICERKNQLNIIHTFRRLVNEGVRAELLFVGKNTSEYAQKCEAYVKENQLEGQVCFKGFVSYAENEIAKCDALICGSTIESFPNVIGEAMAAKVPIISTPVAGVPEVLKDGKNAYVAAGFEEEDIYEAWKRCYNEWNTEKQKKLIENAYQTYETEFSPESVYEKLVNFYEYVLENASKEEKTEIQIEELWTLYSEYVEIFRQNEMRFKRPETMEKIIWMLPFMKKKIQEKGRKKLVIWGAGVYGAEAKTLAESFFPELELQYFLDGKKTGEYLGIPIVKPEKNYFAETIVWIAHVAGQTETIKKLEIAGKDYQEDYFIIAPRVW